MSARFEDYSSSSERGDCKNGRTAIHRGKIVAQTGRKGEGLPFRPVAPDAAPRASSMTMLGFRGASAAAAGAPSATGMCLSRFHATAAPVMPLPMMTTSADAGRTSVLRVSAIRSGGSCQ